jgi:hypothetical protein
MTFELKCGKLSFAGKKQNCSLRMNQRPKIVVRKGKSMGKILTYSMKNLRRPYDNRGTILPAAGKAAGVYELCSKYAGPSGNLIPGEDSPFPD